MESQEHILHHCDFYEIRDFRCACTECSVSKIEQGKHFFIIFVRRGFYEQQVFKGSREMHIGRILVSKPDIEFTIRHIDRQPDVCTSFRFDPSFYKHVKEQYDKEAHWFFANPDLHSVLLSSNPSIEYLHQHILSRVGHGPRLEIDALVVRLLEKVMHTLGNRVEVTSISGSLRKHHLSTAENACDYLLRHFMEDVSLAQLADHCHVSVFHFCRIFKAILNVTPHHYLTELRLNHAQLLLQSAHDTVTQVAYQSGFTSLEHFVTAYRQRFGYTPRYERETDSIRPWSRFQN